AGGSGQTPSQPKDITSLYDLINSSVSIPASDGSSSTTYPSPLNGSSGLNQLLPVLLDKVSTTQNTELVPRINVNTAPAEVLAALPGLSDSDVQPILSARPSLMANQGADPTFLTPAWLISQAGLTPAKAKSLEKYVTAQSQVFRVQVLGYFENGGPGARVAALIHPNPGPPARRGGAPRAT